MSQDFSDNAGHTLRPASLNDIPVIQQITHATWPVAYGAILISEQLSYMLKLIYSTEALQKQMSENQQFYLAIRESEPVGFASFSQTEPGIFKLHKLYVLPGNQKSGTGKFLMQSVESIIKGRGATKLQLNVNRHNKALIFYQKNGFSILKAEDIDIGSGYFMNDYILEKQLN